MAFLHIQRAWGGDSSNPFRVLFDAFKQIGSVTHYFSLWAIAGLFFCWRLAKRKRWHELLIGLLFILIPLSIRINSFPRYLVGSFVPMLALFDDFTELSRDKKIVLAFLGILLEFVLLGDWFQSANYLT